MIQINKRIIVVCILLSIITFGIYGIYWLYLLVKNTRSIQKNTTSCTGEMLCLMFVPFYSLYWWYTRGEKVKQEFSQHNYASTGNGIVYLILAIFGLSIVSMAIMQSDFNSLKSETHSEQRSAGKITLFGEDLSKFKENYKIGYVSQKANSFNSDFPATVKEVVMANLYSRRGLFKRYRKEDYEKLSTVLEKVGMSGYENRLIGNLSGGQQQRIFIARALISEPELLLMDEPTVGVDAKSVRQIMDIISELNKQGMTIIMTNHDTPELVRVSDKLLIFCEHGNGEFVSRNDLTMQQINEIFAGKRVHHHG